MKTAAEIRAMQEEIYKDYYDKQQMEKEQNIQRQLSAIEVLILSTSKNYPPINWIAYSEERILPEVKEILVSYGFVVTGDLDDSICTKQEKGRMIPFFRTKIAW